MTQNGADMFVRDMAAARAVDNSELGELADGASTPPTDLLNRAAKRGIAIKIHDLTEPAFDIRAAHATTCGTVMDMLVPDARQARQAIEWPTRSAKRKRTTGLSVFKRPSGPGESSVAPSEVSRIQDDLLNAYDDLCSLLNPKNAPHEDTILRPETQEPSLDTGPEAGFDDPVRELRSAESSRQKKNCLKQKRVYRNVFGMKIRSNSSDIEVPELHNRTRVLNDSLKRAQKRLKRHGRPAHKQAVSISADMISKYNAQREEPPWCHVLADWQDSDQIVAANLFTYMHGQVTMDATFGKKKTPDVAAILRAQFSQHTELPVSPFMGELRTNTSHNQCFILLIPTPELFLPRTGGLLISASIERYMDVGKIVIVPDLPERPEALELLKWLTSQSRRICPLKEEEEEEVEYTEYMLGSSLG
ncbi:hypothetical protein N7454_006280 [Penicillium verhagenii]|nr:hypothetical protein N7454_006280 [Penicillium verhagenii]